MATTALNQRFYRYSVESFDILFTDEPNPSKVSPQYVNSIIIQKDFDNDFFPLLRVKVMLDTELYYKIVYNKSTVRFRLRIQKYVYDSTKTVQYKKDVINELFCIFLDENTPFTEKQMHDKSKDTSGEGSSPQNTGGKEFTFYFFKESDLLNSKKIINSTLDNVNMTEVVTYCLAQAGFKNILLSPFDNKTEYNEVLIPPFTILGLLDYLENQYGFFFTGLLSFFDFDRAYMIDQGPKCTSWVKEEYKKTTFNVKYETNPDSLSPGSYDNTDEKTFYINIVPGNITMNSLSVIVDQLEGNNIYFVDPSSGAVNTHKADVQQRGTGTYRVVVDNYNNPYVRTSERIQREEVKNSAELVLSDFDIDALTPNKEFIITFEDSSLAKTFGGNYRLAHTMITLVKQGEELVISANASLRKSK